MVSVTRQGRLDLDAGRRGRHIPPFAGRDGREGPPRRGGWAMRPLWRATVGAVGALALGGAAGCAGRPLLDNPVLVRPDPNAQCANPVYLSLGPPDYAAVFEAVLDV